VEIGILDVTSLDSILCQYLIFLSVPLSVMVLETIFLYSQCTLNLVITVNIDDKCTK